MFVINLIVLLVLVILLFSGKIIVQNKENDFVNASAILENTSVLQFAEYKAKTKIINVKNITWTKVSF